MLRDWLQLAILSLVCHGSTNGVQHSAADVDSMLGDFLATLVGETRGDSNDSVTDQARHGLQDLNVMGWLTDKQMTQWTTLLREMTSMGSVDCGEDLFRVAYEAYKTLQQAETHCSWRMHSKTAAVTWKCDSKQVESSVYGSLWALRMFDVWGRPRSGVVSQGQLLWLGDYLQCTHLQLPIFDNKTAKYCIAGSGSFKFLEGKKGDDTGAEDGDKLALLSVNYGLCLPPVCQQNDVVNLMHILAKTIGFVLDNGQGEDKNYSSVMELNGRCTGDGVFAWNKATVATVVLWSTLAFLATLATVFDIMQRKRRSQKQKQGAIGSWKTPTYKESSNGSSKTAISAQTQALRECDIETVLSFKSAASIQKSFGHGKWWKKLLLGFSLPLNLCWLVRGSKSLPYSPQITQRIDCIYGLRVLSMLWIVVCHTYLFSGRVTGNLAELAYRVKLDALAQVLHAGTYAVDTFFFLSGMLTSYIFFRRTFKKEGKNLYRVWFWLTFYVHRWLRVVPAYAAIILFATSVFPQMMDGPFWDKASLFGVQCSASSWWRHLLFVYNFYPDECLPWLWYLSVDMQLYFISPLFLVPLWASHTWGTTLCIITIMLSCITRGILTSQSQLPPNMYLLLSPKVYNNDYAAYFQHIYIKPYTRAAPFIVGILFGWYLVQSMYKTKKPKPAKSPCKDQMHLWLGWTSNTVLVLCLLFGAYPLFVDALHSGVYNFLIGGTGRCCWAVSIAFTIYLCRKKRSCCWNLVLSWPGWRPLARLTYGVFLVHELVIVAYYYSLTRPHIFHGHMQMLALALMFCLLSLFCAVILNLLVESPPRAIERLLFRRRSRPVAKVDRKCRRASVVQSESIPAVQRSSMTDAWVRDPRIKFSDIPHHTNNVPHKQDNSGPQDTSQFDDFDCRSVKRTSSKSTVSFDENPRIHEFDPEQEVLDMSQRDDDFDCEDVILGGEPFWIPRSKLHGPIWFPKTANQSVQAEQMEHGSTRVATCMYAKDKGRPDSSPDPDKHVEPIFDASKGTSGDDRNPNKAVDSPGSEQSQANDARQAHSHIWSNSPNLLDSSFRNDMQAMEQMTKSSQSFQWTRD